MRMQPHHKTALFLVMDVIPTHIARTFGLDENGQFKHNMTGMVMVKSGDTIPDNLDFVLIVHDVSNWHTNKAEELATQIESLNSHTYICSISVIQDAPVPQQGNKMTVPVLPPAPSSTSPSMPPVYWPNPLVPFEVSGQTDMVVDVLVDGQSLSSAIRRHVGPVYNWKAEDKYDEDGKYVSTSMTWAERAVDPHYGVAQQILDVFGISPTELGMDSDEMTPTDYYDVDWERVGKYEED